MYYEEKYLFRFESSNGKTREIRVLHREAGDRAILEASDDNLLTEHTGLFLVVRTYSETQRAQGRAKRVSGRGGYSLLSAFRH